MSTHPTTERTMPTTGNDTPTLADRVATLDTALRDAAAAAHSAHTQALVDFRAASAKPLPRPVPTAEWLAVQYLGRLAGELDAMRGAL